MGLFGPSKREVFERLAYEVQARYIKGSFWKNAKVEHRIRGRLVVLDEYTVSTGKSSITYTRIRAPYMPKDHFRFQIYRKGLFSGIAKFFGAQDIQTGDDTFDAAFIIKSDDDWHVRRLLDEAALRAMIMGQKTFHLHNRKPSFFTTNPLPHGGGQLEFQVASVIRDVGRLKELFAIFGMVLDGLHAMGAITDENLDVDY